MIGTSLNDLRSTDYFLCSYKSRIELASFFVREGDAFKSEVCDVSRKVMVKSSYFDCIVLPRSPYFLRHLEPAGTCSFSDFLFLALVILSREL